MPLEHEGGTGVSPVQSDHEVLVPVAGGPPLRVESFVLADSG